MNSTQIHKAIREHVFNGWIYITEFRAGTGYAMGSNRYLDAWCMQAYPSSPMCRVAIEIKISRSDFNAELRKPMKRDSALSISNEFYFAAPHGLIREVDLPDEAGLIEVFEDGIARITSKAKHRDNLPTWPFVASLARRVLELEMKEMI